MAANRWWCFLPISLLASCGGDDSGQFLATSSNGPDAKQPASVGRVSRDPSFARLRAAYLASVQTNAPAIYDLERDPSGPWMGQNPAQRAQIRMTSAGVHLARDVEGAPRALDVQLGGLGCSDEIEPATQAELSAKGNRIELRREGLVEWYVSGPLGVEQGFEIEKAPACRSNGGADVTIAVRMQGLTAELDTHGNAVSLRDENGNVVFRYSDLHVVDATQRVLPSGLSVKENVVSIHIDDTDALYPIFVDPILWSETQKLLATDPGVGDAFATAVAIDGDTAIIGAPTDDEKGVDAGAAYVFVRDPVMNTWTQTQKLMSGDASATAGDNFGKSVSISGDAIAIGAPVDNTSRGAVFVFQRTAAALPFTQLQKITAPNAANGDQFGGAVAIAGTSITIGAPFDDNGIGGDAGSAFVYFKSGATYALQATLTAGALGAPGDEFGSAVAISADTTLIGSYGDDANGSLAGAAYVFVRVGAVWSQQSKFLPVDIKASDRFGWSVALSGETALIGAPLASTSTGAAYAYVRNAGTWMQQKKFTALDADASDQFGHSVAISGDTAIIGARADEPKGTNSGSAYVFLRNAGVWAQEKKFVASDETAADEVGASVGVSGTLAIVGGPKHDGAAVDAGAAWFVTPVNKLDNGQACMKGTDCVSEICVDGVCCDSSCGNGAAGDCQACNVAGKLGMCSPVAAGSECRGAGGACDMAEMCDGIATDCPVDVKLMVGTECNASLGACDPAEVCDGATNDCPADSIAALGVICRGSVGECDIEETCDGAAVTCPEDVVLTAGSVCRASAGDCDMEDVCDGVVGACTDNKKAANTECRASNGACETAATCDGATDECPANVLLSAGSVCRDAAGPCDVAETCDGAAAPCPNDALATAGTTCGSASGECSADPVCDGSTTACPNGKNLPDGTVCTDGRCQAGACDSGAGGGGVGGGGGAGEGGGGTGGTVIAPGGGGGCSCRVDGSDGQTHSPVWISVGLGLLAFARRKQSRAASS